MRTPRIEKTASKRHLLGERPWWAIAGLAAIAVLALVLYTWALSRNGMANSYYAAAVKSASLSWKAFFFGSLDPGSFITIDKPPVSIWVMALSVRLFGFSSWSMLVPQALAGLASVLVLHHLVRRWMGELAALLAALILTLTPVAVLIFRFNNPDALLTLLLLLAAWAVWSALERDSTWRLGLAGVALGFAFLTKMLMAFMVLPAFAVVYLVCGPPRLGRRLIQLAVAFAALVVSGGWWVAIVELWPDATRPHVGGTTGDSWIGLILSRSAGVLDTGAQGANLSGDPGWLRIFNDQFGGQVSWLLPLALAGLAVGLAVTLRARREDRARAGYLLWGLWALVMIAVFDNSTGTLHSYYTVVLAPAIAALAGGGAVEMWRLGRAQPRLAWLLPAVVAGSAAWAAVLLSRLENYAPGLGTAVVVVGVVAAARLLAAPMLSRKGDACRLRTRAIVAVSVALSVVALLAGPFAYALSTVARPVSGSTATAGPQTQGPNSARSNDSDLVVDQELIDYLMENQGDAKYLVAVQGTSESVPIILATGEPVVTIGGYKNRDPVPTLAELEAMVAAGELRHVFLANDSRSVSSTSSGSSEQSPETTGDTLKGVIDWVKTQGAQVPASDYGVAAGILYYLPAQEGCP